MPFVRIPQLDMHYETGGSGKQVCLLIHGNFASWRWWQPLLKQPPRGFSFYAPDMRGCGDSDHPEDGYSIAQHSIDLKNLIQTLKLPALHLVGHSLGACVALAYAMRNPKQVKSLTLVAPAPSQGRKMFTYSHWKDAYASRPDSISSAFKLTELLGTTRKVLHRSLTDMMPDIPVDNFFNALVDDAVRMSRDAAVGHLESINEWDVEQQLGQIELPVLIIGGSKDTLIPSLELKKAVEKLPNGRLIIWPNSGHVPQLDHPLRFIKILSIFTKSNSSWFTRMRWNVPRNWWQYSPR